jgi:hypothetical protein
MRYGQKNGDGPTRGKIAATYEAIAPDGVALRKRIFYGDTIGDAGVMAIYQHDGKWHAASIDRADGDKVTAWTHYRWIPARRVKP